MTSKVELVTQYFDETLEALYMRDGHDTIIEVLKLKGTDCLVFDNEIVPAVSEKFELHPNGVKSTLQVWVEDNIQDPYKLLLKNKV